MVTGEEVEPCPPRPNLLRAVVSPTLPVTDTSPAPDRINKELFNGMFRGWVSIESSMGQLRSELYAMGCILKEENSTTGRVFLNIDIGREELDKLLENEGFNICSDEDILLANEG